MYPEVDTRIYDEIPDANLLTKAMEHYLNQHNTVSKAPLPLVQALFEAAPQLVEVKNDAGDLPLHLAVERTAPSAVIDYLLEKYPEAWKRYNKYSTRAEAMGDKKLLLPGEHDVLQHLLFRALCLMPAHTHSEQQPIRAQKPDS